MTIRIAHWLTIGRELQSALTLLALLKETVEEGLEHDLATVLTDETTSALARVTALLHNDRERRIAERPCKRCQGKGTAPNGLRCGLCFGQKTEP